MPLQPRLGILNIAPYTPGRSTASGVATPIKLSANENPLGCSDAARDAFLASAAQLHLYPDSRTSHLRAAIAEKYGLAPQRLIFGAGSDEIFAMACQTYLGPGFNMVQPQFGFAAWAIAARAAGGAVKSAAERAHVVDVDAILAAIDSETRIVFIANPANPTGTWIPFSDVERLHAAMPNNILLVLDGAYAECAAHVRGFSDGLAWSADKQNVLVTRTFSKAHGLASLRIGWGYAAAEVIDAMDRIRLPFSVPRAGEAAAVAALADEAFMQRTLACIAEGRARLERVLSDLSVPTLPSATNFVTANFERAAMNADELEARLAARDVLVRNLRSYSMANWLRISIGSPEAMTAAAAAIRDLLTK